MSVLEETKVYMCTLTFNAVFR